MNDIKMTPMGDTQGETRADRLGERLRGRSRKLSPALQKVAAYLDANRLESMNMSAAELAAAIGTSDATVVRAVQALGFAGLPDLKEALAAFFGETVSPAESLNRTLAAIDRRAENAVDLVAGAHGQALAAMQSPEVRERISAATTLLGKAQRIVVFGLGSSAFLAGYAGALLARNGHATHVLDATGSALADQLLGLRAGDAILMLTYGRAYRESLVVLAEARRLKLPVVMMVGSQDERLARRADVEIPVGQDRTDTVALQGATFVYLEAIMLGLAAINRGRAVSELERLNDLRKTLGGRLDRYSGMAFLTAVGAALAEFPLI
ncbi:MurR/RpiR family transcriptional regulator [Lacibacterium aquatile]|uniref:MurR/RpiR family transcriptional regulator n=1 Tax=Lacibacterium aquatile TaxID=1168082 RepID=A0ABW5DSC7_9PROT